MQNYDFWRRIHQSVADLLGDMAFEEFLQNPWEKMAALSDPSSHYGIPMALCHPSLPLIKGQIRILESDQRVDIGEISDTARQVLWWHEEPHVSCPQNLHGHYVLH